MSLLANRIGPGPWSVARHQFLLILRGRRNELMLGGILVALVLGSDFLGRTPLTSGTSATERIIPFYSLILVCSLLWPLSVWSGESPSKRDYHWSLPVRRGVHDLLRLLAGAALILAGLVIIALAAFILDWWSASPSQAWSPVVWGNYFVAPLILYLIVSIAAIRFNRPDLWLVGTIAAFVAAVSIADRLGLEIVQSAFAAALLKGEYSLHAGVYAGIQSMNMSVPEQAAVVASYWPPAALLWLGLAGAGAVAAAMVRR